MSKSYRDHREITQYEHDESKNAKRVYIIDSDNTLNISKITVVQDYDLVNGAVNYTTDISGDYILDNIEFYFSSNEEKTITIKTQNNTVIYEDTISSQSLHLTNMNIGFHDGENITIYISQTTSTCLARCVIKIRQ